jgi:hypothetical protein
MHKDYIKNSTIPCLTHKRGRKLRVDVTTYINGQ